MNGQTTHFTWDDEDRLTGQTFPNGHTDSYGYTGLGMRLTKSDPTGSYSYLADGVSPASDVLTDGHTTFTPGISEVNGLGSRFYLPDGQGNSRGLLDGNQNATDGYNWDGFGNLVSRFGSNPTGFAWNVSAGYQSDGDSGLKLLGHRYYDSRTGRFISQDPTGDGDNWYAYAGNDPTDATDPLGLDPQYNLPPDWGNTSNPGWMGEPAGVDPGSTYNCPGVGWLTVGGDGFWHPGGGPAAAPSGDVSGPPDANNFGVGGAVDNWVTFGTVTNAGTVAGEFDSHHASRWAVIGAGALAAATILAAGVSQGKDAEAVDTARFIEAWGKGTFETVEESWAYHFGKHGEEVGAESLIQYLRKAEGFNQNLRGATKSVLDNAIRHSKNGKYIIKDFEGKILSFGKIR